MVWVKDDVFNRSTVLSAGRCWAELVAWECGWGGEVTPGAVSLSRGGGGFTWLWKEWHACQQLGDSVLCCSPSCFSCLHVFPLCSLVLVCGQINPPAEDEMGALLPGPSAKTLAQAARGVPLVPTAPFAFISHLSCSVCCPGHKECLAQGSFLWVCSPIGDLTAAPHCPCQLHGGLCVSLTVLAGEKACK